MEKNERVVRFRPLRYGGRGYECAEVGILEIDRLSKDGRKIRTDSGEVYEIASLATCYEEALSAAQPLFKAGKGILFWLANRMAGPVTKIEDDDFDDIIHIQVPFCSGPVDFEDKILRDNDESKNGDWLYFSTAEAFAEYISGRARLKKRNAVLDWLVRHGFDKAEEAEYRDYYSADDLEYAAGQDINPGDFEIWQAWKRCLEGRALPFSAAMKMERALEEDTDGLTIYEYE